MTQGKVITRPDFMIDVDTEPVVGESVCPSFKGGECTRVDGHECFHNWGVHGCMKYTVFPEPVGVVAGEEKQNEY